jgi:pyruvate kinase
MIASLEKASALITEEGGLTSHAAVVGLSLGIPVIVGLENATSVLTEGQVITVDAARGAVYEGRASVL